MRIRHWSQEIVHICLRGQDQNPSRQGIGIGVIFQCKMQVALLRKRGLNPSVVTPSNTPWRRLFQINTEKGNRRASIHKERQSFFPLLTPTWQEVPNRDSMTEDGIKLCKAHQSDPYPYQKLKDLPKVYLIAVIEKPSDERESK